jgi:hypothetical protein
MPLVPSLVPNAAPEVPNRPAYLLERAQAVGPLHHTLELPQPLIVGAAQAGAVRPASAPLDQPLLLAIAGLIARAHRQKMEAYLEQDAHPHVLVVQGAVAADGDLISAARLAAVEACGRGRRDRR